MGFLDFGYAYARNDIVYDRFYNVISTGVRTIVRTQRRNPPRKKNNVRINNKKTHGRGIMSEETTNIFPAVEIYRPCKQQKNPPRKRYNVLINNKKLPRGRNII